MSRRTTETLLAKWRELERAIDAVDDPRLRTALEAHVEEVKAEYQASVHDAADEDLTDEHGAAAGLEATA